MLKEGDVSRIARKHYNPLLHYAVLTENSREQPRIWIDKLEEAGIDYCIFSQSSGDQPPTPLPYFDLLPGIMGPGMQFSCQDCEPLAEVLIAQMLTDQKHLRDRLKLNTSGVTPLPAAIQTIYETREVPVEAVGLD
jgi:hypothetical protein